MMIHYFADVSRRRFQPAPSAAAIDVHATICAPMQHCFRFDSHYFCRAFAPPMASPRYAAAITPLRLRAEMRRAISRFVLSRRRRRRAELSITDYISALFIRCWLRHISFRHCRHFDDIFARY